MSTIAAPLGVEDDRAAAQDGAGKAGRPKVRCRAIEEADLDAAVALLGIGFADRAEDYWRTGFARHRAQPLPDGVPRYGYLIERDGEAVGVLLTLYRVVEEAGATHLRCNLSSWYVKPEFRMLGTMLDAYAMRDKSVTYVNVSPAPTTWTMHEARGFKAICKGQMLIVPLLGLLKERSRGRVHAASPQSLALLPEAEARLVADHLSYGCTGFVWEDGANDGVKNGVKAGALLFQRRAIKFLPHRLAWLKLPCFQVVYRSPGLDLAACLGPLGRRLILAHAMPWFVLDATGPLPGVAGRYFAARAPKYAKGPNPPQAGDLAYTEIVVFGS